MNYFKEKAGARSSETIMRDYAAEERSEAQEGMALIDWFAGQVLCSTGIDYRMPPDVKANDAYLIAKAMMDERAKLMEGKK